MKPEKYADLALDCFNSIKFLKKSSLRTWGVFMVRHLKKPCRLHMYIHIYIQNKKTTSLCLIWVSVLLQPLFLSYFWFYMKHTWHWTKAFTSKEKKKRSLTRLFYVVLWYLCSQIIITQSKPRKISWHKVKSLWYSSCILWLRNFCNCEQECTKAWWKYASINISRFLAGLLCPSSLLIHQISAEFISFLGILPLSRRCYLTPRCQSLDLYLINKNSMAFRELSE